MVGQSARNAGGKKAKNSRLGRARPSKAMPFDFAGFKLARRLQSLRP